MRSSLRLAPLRLAVCGLALASPAALADTTDVRWQNRVIVAKSGDHCADDPNCMNRYHPAIPMIANADPGAYIVFETRDALDTDLTLDSNADDLAAVDLNLVHPMTGPVRINGAKRGDVLAVTLVDIEPDEFGYTLIVPGFGFLRDLYTEPFFVGWRTARDGAESDAMPGVRIPMAAFPGSIGVLPGEPEVEAWMAREAALGAAGGIALPPQPIGAQPAAVCGEGGSHANACLRTIPPRENGGNMDVQQMQVGTTLLLPCFVDGCGLFIGDVHFAQGDGEVSGTAIEIGARVTVRAEIRPGAGAAIKAPQYEGGAELKAIAPAKFYAAVGFPIKESGTIPPFLSYIDDARIADLENLNEDLGLAARNALIDLIDYIQREHGLTREQAYILASVAADLVIGQVVDVPNYTVSAILDLTVFED